MPESRRRRRHPAPVTAPRPLARALRAAILASAGAFLPTALCGLANARADTSPSLFSARSDPSNPTLGSELAELIAFYEVVRERLAFATDAEELEEVEDEAAGRAGDTARRRPPEVEGA